MYLFPEDTLKTDKEIIFEHTELGYLSQILPLKELSKLLPEKKNNCGAPSWFDRKGLIALLFLQSYTQFSDRAFIEHMNGNWQMQMFCGIQLETNEQIRDKNLMSRVRKYVSQYLDLEKFQQILVKYWKGHLEDTHVGMCDATVYESSLRYPTDVKLLWECCSYIQEQINVISHESGIKISSKKFEKRKHDYLNYARRRKKFYKATRKMQKVLVSFLARQVKRLQQLFDKVLAVGKVKIPDKVFEKVKTIKEIINQQKYLVSKKGNKVKDRIVSLHKPYVRAIVRGKETKTVEFGAKVHMMQIDGINYIEHFSYDAYNEATRLKISIAKHKQLTGECTHWSADAIYATNKNRRFTSAHSIITNFIPKGPSTKEEDIKTVKSLLNIARATRLEGSFGTEKNFYGLSKVKARTEETERLSIYFSVMTANAVRLSKRIRGQDISKAA